jgi:hypothetical protein
VGKQEVVMFVLVCKREDGTKTPVSETFPDRVSANLAAETKTKSYAKHGRNEEQDYWWARDKDGSLLKFFVE